MAADGEQGMSMVTDHPYVPRRESWSRCRDCRLYEASHANTAVERVGSAGAWYGLDGKWIT